LSSRFVLFFSRPVAGSPGCGAEGRGWGGTPHSFALDFSPVRAGTVLAAGPVVAVGCCWGKGDARAPGGGGVSGGVGRKREKERGGGLVLSVGGTARAVPRLAEDWTTRRRRRRLSLLLSLPLLLPSPLSRPTLPLLPSPLPPHKAPSATLTLNTQQHRTHSAPTDDTESTSRKQNEPPSTSRRLSHTRGALPASNSTRATARRL
jgi:hypothetical protein